MADASDYPIHLTKLEDLTVIKEIVNGEDDAYRWMDITYLNGWTLRVSIYNNVFLVDSPYDLRLTDKHGNLVPGVLDTKKGHWGTPIEGKIEGTDLDTVSHAILKVALRQDLEKKERIDPLWIALLGFAGVIFGLYQGWPHFGIACLLVLIASLFLSYRRQ
jgi:hypothetical protein